MDQIGITVYNAEIKEGAAHLSYEIFEGGLPVSQGMVNGSKVIELGERQQMIITPIVRPSGEQLITVITSVAQPSGEAPGTEQP